MTTQSLIYQTGKRAVAYAAKEAAKYAAQQVYKEAVRTGKNYISGTVKRAFRPRTTTATTYKPRYKPTYRAAVKPSRRTYTKKRKLVKLVGTSKNKNIYNRKYKPVRRHNTGPLQLQSRLQSGDSLPNMTFARLKWRGSGGLSFATNSAQDVGRRSFCLNELSANGPALATHSGLDHGPTYLPLWEKLYEEYMVFGSKFTVKISPMVQSTLIAAKTQTGGTAFYSVPANAQPGYWYIRVYYKRNTPSDEIGYPIQPGTSTTIDDKLEDYWPSLREFLSDPTVTYKKDRTVVRNKLHQHHTGDLGSTTSGNIPTNSTSSFSTEIESHNKPVTLSIKFSAKKDFKDKNIMQNFPWMDFNSSLADPYRFHVRYGYIGFNSNGNVAYHIPVDRQVSKFCETEIEYFVGLRNPLIGPHTETMPASNRMAMDEPMEIPDEEEFFAEEDEPQEIPEEEPQK